MQRLLSSAIMFVFVAGFGGGAASAKACHDAKGKFMKCPTSMSSMSAMKPMKPMHCRDAKGKFMKCKSK